MAKYVNKQFKTLLALEADSPRRKDFEINAVKQTKDTTIETPYGPALITKGNYIVTLPNGDKIGMAPSDLELNYERV